MFSATQLVFQLVLFRTLTFYLWSTYIQFEGTSHLQKWGICTIPVLSDSVLAHFDSLIYTLLMNKNVLKVFRFVVISCFKLRSAGH